MTPKFKQLEKELLTGDAETVVRLRCPSCGGGLNATFSDVAGKHSLIIRCRSSCYRSTIDGLNAVPPWVAVIGRRLET